jgi:hypothetical protein
MKKEFVESELNSCKSEEAKFFIQANNKRKKLFKKYNENEDFKEVMLNDTDCSYDVKKFKSLED